MRARILVDGQVVETVPFVNEIIAEVVKGLVTPLRGVRFPKKIVIEVDLAQN